ncbi:MAG: hypothetical protein ACK5CE_09600, partial [Actinomycetes bacterium]
MGARCVRAAGIADFVAQLASRATRELRRSGVVGGQLDDPAQVASPVCVREDGVQGPSDDVAADGQRARRAELGQDR